MTLEKYSGFNLEFLDNYFKSYSEKYISRNQTFDLCQLHSSARHTASDISTRKMYVLINSIRIVN